MMYHIQFPLQLTNKVKSHCSYNAPLLPISNNRISNLLAMHKYGIITMMTILLLLRKEKKNRL